jgi:hypothetical protein
VFNPDFVSVEVALQHIDRARTVGEGNIGIRPEQIECVLREASLPIFRSPCENMQRKIVFPAPRRQFRAGGAIEMDLLGHSHQRVVVIDAVKHDPGQPIAAVNVASFSVA